MSREFKQVETVKITHELISTTCNCCGTIEQDGDYNNGTMYNFKLGGWYGSYYPGDMDTIDFDVCGKCLEQFVKTFKIPVEGVEFRGEL